MKSTVFTLLRFIVALLTVLVIAGRPYIPPKTLQIYPAVNTISSIYGTGNTTTWINQDRNEWRCDYRSVNDVCGLTLSWDSCRTPPPSVCQDVNSGNDEACMAADLDINDNADQTNSPINIVPLSVCSISDPTIDSETPRTVDFSGYAGMNVKIYYEGKAKFLRLYLRNHEDAARAPETQKFMSTFLGTDDLKAGEAYVSLSEFSVAEWWILSANIPRELVPPKFDQIGTVGIDNMEYGVHRMRVERVELTGERISTEKLLIALLIFWAGYLLLEASARYYYLRNISRQREVKINQLTCQAQKLEQEKNVLKNQTITDPLTMALNRTGLQQKISTWSDQAELPVNIGLLIFDVDHFKNINDNYGHDIGDRILKALVVLIEANVRDSDIFARWGGEEFFLVTRYVSEDNLMRLAEKFRMLIAEYRFEAPLDLNITVSIGAAISRTGDTFDTLSKRADIALYRAKVTRNCSVYE